MPDRRARKRLFPIQGQMIEPSKEKERELVEVEARSRLRRSGHRQLHLVSCEFREGVLTLCGQVSSCYLKQLAQTLAGKVDGVEEIDNQLEVPMPPERLA